MSGTEGGSSGRGPPSPVYRREGRDGKGGNARGPLTSPFPILRSLLAGLFQAVRGSKHHLPLQVPQHGDDYNREEKFTPNLAQHRQHAV